MASSVATSAAKRATTRRVVELLSKTLSPMQQHSGSVGGVDSVGGAGIGGGCNRNGGVRCVGGGGAVRNVKELDEGEEDDAFRSAHAAWTALHQERTAREAAERQVAVLQERIAELETLSARFKSE